MSIITIGDHLLHYEAIGRGKPLIFVHGWLGSWRYWWPSMQEMSTHYRSFAFDMWGYGNSSKEPQEYSFESYVVQLEQFIEELGIARPLNLVGHSLGAAVALRYARLWPHNVVRLALVALPITGKYINNKLTNSDSVAMATRYLSKPSTYPEVESEIHKVDTAAMNAVASQLTGYNFRSDLQKAGCPILMIYGDRDRIIQQPNGQLGRPSLSGNGQRCITLEGCYHFPMLEQPATFNRLLKDFLNFHTGALVAPKEHWQRRTR